MKNFKITIFKNKQEILLTNTANILSPVYTFDEKLTQRENHKYSLSFSIYKNINTTSGVIENPLLVHVIPYNKIRLYFNDEITDFIITDITYTITKNNIKYDCKAEDYASQKLSKIGQGATITKTGTISEIAATILQATNTNNLWSFNTTGKFMSMIESTEPRKITLDLSNTNLYNAFVELALLYNAELDFDYANKVIIIKDKEKKRFNGFRLRPEINISSFGVSDNISNFTTAMNISGGQDINGLYINALPPIPFEVKLFFADCVENDFNSDNWFKCYERTPYMSFYNRIITDYGSSATDAEAVKKYLLCCDILPHLDNTLYDIAYFKYKGQISNYKNFKFNDILNNEIRKSNIKIILKSEQFYSFNNDYLALYNEIKFNIQTLVSEELYYKIITSQTPPVSQSIIDNSLAKLADYKKKLETIVLGNDFINIVCHLYGKTSTFNPFTNKLIDENNLQLTALREEYTNNKIRIAEITTQMEGLTDTSPKYIILKAEKAGLEKAQEYLLYTIGDYDDSTQGSIGVLQWMNYYFNLAAQKVNTTITGDFESLYDLIENESSPDNLKVLKKEIKQRLLSEFQDYIIETYYDNSKELDSYSLLEQAYTTFYGTNMSFTNSLLNLYPVIAAPTTGVFISLVRESSSNTLYNQYLYKVTITPTTAAGVNAVKSGINILTHDLNINAYTKYCYNLMYQNITSNDVVISLTAPNNWNSINKPMVENNWSLIGASIDGLQSSAALAQMNVKVQYSRAAINTPIEIYITQEEFYKGIDKTVSDKRKELYESKLGYSTPNRVYNLSFIDLSYLSDYIYLGVQIGDKIELYEPQLGIEGQEVVITQIDYDLRDANNTQLGIKLITEDIELLQKLLLNL